mgnify:CR=1 FL=1
MRVKRVEFEVIRAMGNFNVKATHRSTIEVTKDEYLTPKGDCIVGIKADKAPRDLSDRVKSIIRSDNSLVIALFIGNDVAMDVVVGSGSHELTLDDDRRMIFRKSSYISPNTIMIKANKAAIDLNRSLINYLKRPDSRLTLVLIALEVEENHE